MYINIAKVKKRINGHGKRCSHSFLNYLDERIIAIIDEAIENSRHFKTVTEKDVIKF